MVTGTSIPDTTGYQMTIQVPTNCEKQIKQNMHWNEQKTSMNFISLDLWPQQPWPRSTHLQCLQCHEAASLSSAVQECWWTQEVPGWRLEQNIIDTAINEWRKHLCACVRTKGWYFEYFLKAVGQLDNWINCQPKWQKSGYNVLYVCYFN